MSKVNRLRNLFEFYSVFDLLLLVKDVLISKVCLGFNVRVVRMPYRIRGRKHIRFGNNFSAGINLRMEVVAGAGIGKPELIIGSNVKINDYVHIGCLERVVLGNDVLIGSHVLIEDHNHGKYGGAGTHSSPSTPPDERPLFSKPVIINDNVWLGEFVAVLPGVEIGRGSIVGALSTVTSNIPEYSIAIGSPAKVIKKYDFEKGEWVKI